MDHLHIELLLKNLICLLELDLNKGNDWPSAGGLLQFKEDLQEQKHTLENDELLCLVEALHELNQVRHGLSILLHLVTHRSDVVQKDGVNLRTALPVATDCVLQRNLVCHCTCTTLRVLAR